MKKLFVALLAVLMIAALSVGTFADDIRPTDVVASADRYVVFKTQKPEMFSWDGIFQAGLNYGSVVDGAALFPASADRQYISCYYDQEGWDNSYSIITGTYKYFALTYKSAGSFTIHWMFSYNSTDGSEFDANGYNPDFTFPASADWTTAVLAIPSDKIPAEASLVKLCRFDMLTSEADVYISDMGFFATEAEAQAYYNPAPETDAPVTEAPVTEAPATEAPATEAPVTDAPVTDAPATDAPAPDTSDILGVSAAALAVAAICTVTVLGKKKK